MEYLQRYSTQRLLGEHVPYAIEAWPEGNQRHLAAESGLYCRIVTEGLFGIRPARATFIHAECRALPESWNNMSLKKIRRVREDNFDLKVLHEKVRNGS
jgi:cellobiose phosphorylase